MGVTLSLELLVTGTAENVQDFWGKLKRQGEELSSNHFFKLINGSATEEDPFTDYEVTFPQENRLSIAWSGGFGGFDRAFSWVCFRDDGIALSERFPTLTFTLYYDSHGASFGGSYGIERYITETDGGSEEVYAGAVRYKAGVRLAEKTLTEEDYFLKKDASSIAAEDVDEESLFLEPDHENNRGKIDTALDCFELRPSTLYNRAKWQQEWIEKSTYDIKGLVFESEFWREIPLINTDIKYIDHKIALSALRQSDYSILFIPYSLISDDQRELTSRNNEFLRLMLSISEGDDETQELDKLVNSLFLSFLNAIATSDYVVNLIKQDPDRHPMSSDSAEFPVEITRALLYVRDFNPVISLNIKILSKALKIRDYLFFRDVFLEIMKLIGAGAAK
jgi:hypothetical protein